MNSVPDHPRPLPAVGDEISDGVFDAVRVGYGAVYTALPRSDTFSRLWRTARTKMITPEHPGKQPHTWRNRKNGT
jgi:hypothetical protein